MADLPEVPEPFDPNALCPMCGYGDPASFGDVVYCWDNNCEGDEHGDHLHQTCESCTFSWPVMPITNEMLVQLTKEQKDAEAEQDKIAEEDQKFTEKKRELDLKKAAEPPKAAAPAKKAAPKAAAK